MQHDELEQRVIQAAIEARLRAYAPYSKFLVGAALVTPGQIYQGCNVENASYGLTICAERAAAFTAVSAGQKRFELLAIATDGGHAPCGACRQVLAEFGLDLPLLLIDTKDGNKTTKHNLRTLLPHYFRLAQTTN